MSLRISLKCIVIIRIRTLRVTKRRSNWGTLSWSSAF